jgi:hypothetical protein
MRWAVTADGAGCRFGRWAGGGWVGGKWEEMGLGWIRLRWAVLGLRRIAIPLPRPPSPLQPKLTLLAASGFAPRQNLRHLVHSDALRVRRLQRARGAGQGFVVASGAVRSVPGAASLLSSRRPVGLSQAAAWCPTPHLDGKVGAHKAELRAAVPRDVELRLVQLQGEVAPARGDSRVEQQQHGCFVDLCNLTGQGGRSQGVFAGGA